MLIIANLLIFIVGLIGSFVRLAITPIKLTPPAPAMEYDGALPNNGALTLALSQLAQNAAPAFLNFNQSLIPNTPVAATLTGQQLVGGFIRRFNPGAAFTDSTDNATNIVNAIPGAVPLQTFPVIIANMGSGLMTLGAGTGVTISGTATISSNSVRMFLGQVTGSAAVTFTSLFQFGQNPALPTIL